MAKYRRKHKKNSVLLIGIVVIAILIFISVGYSLWSDTLNINGTANTKYKEPKLDTITVAQTDGEYFVVEDPTSSIKFVKEVKGTSVNNGDEKIEAVGNYEIRTWNVSGRNVEFSLSFTNNYSVTITNGRAELLENTTNYTITTSQTETIATNGTGTFTIIVTLKANSSLSTGTIKYKVSYNVDGVTRYLYVTITFE
ncbi:MAG: hypothetical protein ACI4UX_04315 [Clostridia bacterium]